MKKTFRSALTFALALVMVATCMVGTAFAASFANKEVGGHSASVRIAWEEGNSYATATTSISGVTNAYVTAEARLYYRLARGEYYSFASDAQTNGYTVATATQQLYGAVSCGAKGIHFITFSDFSGTHTWDANDTTKGIILPNAQLEN